MIINHLLRTISKQRHVRYLSLLEYQSREILKGNGIEMPQFCVVDQSSVALFEKFNAPNYVVKAQIEAGGRGRGHFDTGFKGGVHLTSNRLKVIDFISKMLGNHLITAQTTKEGMKVNKIMISEAVVDIESEAYFSIVIDPAYNNPLVIISSMGGVNIESVAREKPELVHKIPIDIDEGLTYDKALTLCKLFKFRPVNSSKAAKLLVKLWEIFINFDAIQIEINPLVETLNNKLTCLDCKINIDNNAKFRHSDLFGYQDTTPVDPLELEAMQNNLNYVSLEGNIGCMVNGAGLAMATVDLIKLLGGEPANFMDVGGSCTADQVVMALKILSSNPKVKAIFINVFGGIVSCNVIADGIVQATKERILKVPIVLRMKGTDLETALTTLKDNNVEVIFAEGMEDAAKEAINLCETRSQEKIGN